MVCRFPVSIFGKITVTPNHESVNLWGVSRNSVPSTAFLVRVVFIAMFISFTPSLTKNANADTNSLNDRCSTYVPIKFADLAALCGNRVLNNLQEYYPLYFSEHWVEHLERCEKDEIIYLTHRFLSPLNAKKFNEELNKLIKLQTEIVKEIECADGSCGSILRVFTSTYIHQNIRLILFAVIDALNNRIRRERCK
ncbi:MAG: hypothetical protein HQL74_06460 [Magnetococcales bacterium]|nr:hypothetical protein [Magnetococcales bacterium]